MATKRITAKLLSDYLACDEGVALFERFFPKGVVPTLAMAQNMKYYDLDTYWAGYNLLSGEPYHQFVSEVSGLDDETEMKRRMLSEKYHNGQIKGSTYDCLFAKTSKEWNIGVSVAFVKAWRKM